MEKVKKLSGKLVLGSVFFLVSLFFITSVNADSLQSDVALNIERADERQIDSYLIRNGLTREEVSKLDIETKKLTIEDFKDILAENPQEKLIFREEEKKKYFKNSNGQLEEITEVDDSHFYLQSTIPEEDLALWFGSIGTSHSDIYRIYANFEWKKAETAPREFIGFAKETDLDIAPDSYEARIQYKTSSGSSWYYYGDAGGRPYEIDSNNGATWNWSGPAYYYKGFVSYRIVKDSSDTSAIFEMEYASDYNSTTTSVSANLGPITVNHKLSDGSSMLKAPHRQTVYFN
ncbi:hypothetical protein [Gracilibacillus sp. YIM 98692]|uniref:hypothetical protein n=1 Tax=Gracilibacillus sp. YIM 98692 TaxID=2663532 RepID=UPI0013D533E6|nr:hypothetical protein [Gracilibacillus sp. YIM 98692]